MDITVQELKHRLDQGEKIIIVDVRENWEADEYNIGAPIIPLGDLLSRSIELIDHQHDEIVLHCRSGGRSAMAKMMLESQGFTNVRNLEGGIVAWRMMLGE